MFGIYLLIARTTGSLAASGALLTVISLAGRVGVELVLNLVFPYVDPGVIMALRAGPLGNALTAVSVLFLLGTVVFMVALRRTSGVPKGAVLRYTASAIPIALRTIFPETVLQLV